MKAKIFSHNQLIGTTALKVGDKTMGALFGFFSPTDYYYENIQKTVFEFWQTNKPDYKKWEALRINLQLENGIFLFPEGGYSIADNEAFAENLIQIDIAGVASKILEDFFLTNPARIFVEEPWSDLTIAQKIAFENELMLEIGSNKKSFLNDSNSKNKHLLSDATFSAFCHDQRNDDVLFAIKKPNSDKAFALVHLTWKTKQESEGYPKTELYDDFDHFKLYKMFEDKRDWES